jgi:hypothetical protein
MSSRSRIGKGTCAIATTGDWRRCHHFPDTAEVIVHGFRQSAPWPSKLRKNSFPTYPIEGYRRRNVSYKMAAFRQDSGVSQPICSL